ncbi:hypothetical protein [Bacteriovorax sp. DB6_IX]|uniref:hypothetical protein n=1 Tax=Bacteriovorax sp. DB6_IX TaxID=1353530 RepID=UPI00038A076C|nr:hypothetical protein [Bacteriovorax sp. DB6_IX]EQC49848.1 hypothetical protein M901_2407 [Bacteriovorax sp. DB6_IX]
MVTKQVVEDVAKGLEVLMKKYKLNAVPGDKERYEATKKAHTALRKVILTMEIKGDIQTLSPIKNGKKFGWMVIDLENNSKNYCV